MEPEQRQAREIAAEQSGYVEHARAAFRAGWDAAMVYVEEERIRSCTADMEVKLDD